MEYTYEDVMSALRNADAAGDTEAAARLAQIASSMSSQPEESNMLGEIGRQVGLTARGAISGLTAIPGMVADAPVIVANQFGANLPLPSEAQQQLMTRAGLPEPQNQMERAVQTGVGAMTGVGAEAALASAVGKNLGTQVLAPLTQQLGTQTAVAGVAAPVATVGSEAISEKTSSPILGIAAGIASGVMAGGATAKAIKMGQPVPTPVTIEDVRKKSSASFNAVSEAGITVKPLSALGIVNKMRKDLDEFNFNPELDNHKPIATLLKQFERQIGQQRVKFTRLEQMRGAANQMKTSSDPVTKLLAGSLVNSMDIALSRIKPTDVITGAQNVKEALKTLIDARSTWRVSARAQILEDTLDVAAIKALDPKASQSELIRRGLINLAANKKRMVLFNSDEQKAIKQTANSGTGDALLSFVARFNPQRSNFVAGGALSGLLFDPITTLGVTGTGFAADKLQTALKTKQAQELVSGMLTGTLKEPAMSPNRFRALTESVKASSQ